MTFKQKIFYGFSTAILSTTLAFTAVAQEPESLIEKTQSSIKESTYFYHKLHDDHLLGTKILAVVRSLPTLMETLTYLRNGELLTIINPDFLQEMIESYSFTQIDTRLYEPTKDTSMVDLVFHGLNFEVLKICDILARSDRLSMFTILICTHLIRFPKFFTSFSVRNAFFFCPLFFFFSDPSFLSTPSCEQRTREDISSALPATKTTIV